MFGLNIQSLSIKFRNQPIIVKIEAGDVVELKNGQRAEVKRVMISPYYREELAGIIRLDVKFSSWNINRFGRADYILVTDVKWVLKAQQAEYVN